MAKDKTPYDRSRDRLTAEAAASQRAQARARAMADAQQAHQDIVDAAADAQQQLQQQQQAALNRPIFAMSDQQAGKANATLAGRAGKFDFSFLSQYRQQTAQDRQDATADAMRMPPGMLQMMQQPAYHSQPMGNPLAGLLAQLNQTQAGAAQGHAADSIVGGALGGASGAIGGAAGALSMMGPYGMAAGAALNLTRAPLDAANSLYGTINQSAARYAGYSGDLAQAHAAAQSQGELGNLRRGQYLGEELGGFTKARGQPEQAGQDVLATLLKPLIPIATKALELLAQWIEEVRPAAKQAMQELFQLLAAILEALNQIWGIQGKLDGSLKFIKDILQRFKDDLDSKAAEDPFLADFLGMNLPRGENLTDAGAARNGKDEGALAGRLNTPFALP